MPEALFASAADHLTPRILRERGGEKWSAVPPDAIPAWVAEMSFPVAPVVRDALADVVARGELGYVSAQRQQEYREAVSGWYEREHGHGFDPEHVHPVGDVIEAYRKALGSLPADAAVVVPVPSYPPFLFVAAEEARRVVTVPYDATDGIDLEALAAVLEPGSMLVLCNPNNPFGRVAERSELEAVASVVDAAGARVFADEIHAPLVLDGPAHIPYASISETAAAHAVTAFSASKAFDLPGLKCAALITSSPGGLDWWRSLGPIASHGASVTGLVAGAAALRGGRPWLDEVIRYLRSNRDRLVGALAAHPDLVLRPSQATYLQWIEHRGLDTSPAAALAGRGLIVSDGATFGGFDRCFRVNFALPAPLLDAAIEIILDLDRAAPAPVR